VVRSGEGDHAEDAGADRADDALASRPTSLHCPHAGSPPTPLDALSGHDTLDPMSPLDRLVDADDVIVADLLAATLELVAELGGWMSPHACLVARDGQLSLHCDSDDPGPLIRLPRATMVRIGRVTWSDSDERLSVLDIPDDLTADEVELLMLQVALHNQSGKVAWLARTHPVLDPSLPPAVTEAVRWFRPSFRTRRPTVPSVLWSTRAFRLPPGGSTEPEPMALPIVDLLNHHPGGATGTLTDDAFTVDVNRPFGTTECALDYGLERDAIGMAVVYGFADAASPVAHSAPLEIDVPGVGAVRVAAVGRSPTGRLLPPVVRERDGVIEVSHLTFRAGGSVALPQAVPAAVVDAVAERNLALLAELRQRALGAPGSPGAAVLAGAAARQAEVISAR